MSPSEAQGLSMMASTVKHLLIMVILLIAEATAHAKPLPLTRFTSHHYLIHSDMPKAQVVPFGRHMDAIFEQYQRRFASFIKARGDARMPLYLFAHQQDYLDFLASHDIDARNSGGMFFVRPRFQGLATWTRGHSQSQTNIVLQHEGFHQFAWHYLGDHLPVWVNEGLAQYFEDAIIVHHHMKVGLSDAQRIERVRQAIEHDQTLDVEKLLATTPAQWSQTLNKDPQRAALLYAQSWSIVYFLIHGDQNRYQKNFEQYLILLSKRYDSQRAFKTAFGSKNLAGLETRWQAFALAQKPDAINTAAARMEFLAMGLRFIQEHGEPMPKNLEQLRDNLQSRHFRITHQSHGLTREIDSTDDTQFQFPRVHGEPSAFLLLAPVRDDLPPRITAPGLRPEPTLVWSRDPEGQLVEEITFR